VSASELAHSSWLQEPTRLLNDLSPECETHNLADPANDKELRPEINVSKSVIHSRLGSERFTRFSSLKRLVNAIAYLQSLARQEKFAPNDFVKDVSYQQKAERLILKEAQEE